MAPRQIDCFKLNFTYWKLLGIWPTDNYKCFFKYYSNIFIVIFDIAYVIILFSNFYFLPKQLDLFVEDILFAFNEVDIISKVWVILVSRDKINDILGTLESDIFQPDVDDDLKIVEDAKRFIVRYSKTIVVVSYTSNLFYILTPLLAYLLLPVELEWPVCSYSFLPENLKERFIYLLYIFQNLGRHFHMVYNITIDGFLLGLMILIIAQLQVLDCKLRRVTDYKERSDKDKSGKEYFLKIELDKCIKHFEAIYRFCKLVEDVFSVPMFIKFCMSSCIICVFLFIFTMPASLTYHIFLSTFMVVMIMQILLPCWFGSRIIETSTNLSIAMYNCDWTPQSRPFKSSMRLFVERMNKPLSLTAMKMFPVSLLTFTAIMKSAYSFFTLLRNMQDQEL